MGIEPTWSAWKAEVLPLNYIRKVRIQLYENLNQKSSIFNKFIEKKEKLVYNQT